ncbi:MAG TPA: beta-propeller fold lactonase family protein [Terracidiphilus sp.]|nr:beta-propeller fold lactonase family protein [Terracidiphilus sp.]
MKIGRWALLLTMPAFMAGCGNFWQAPSSSSSSSSTASSGVFYIADEADYEVAAYYIDAGTLTKISGSPYTLSSAPLALAIAPNGSFLYVSTAQGIFLYTISSSGELTLSNNSAAISSDVAATMKVDSTDSWLVEAGPNAAEVLAIPIDSSTGVPTSSTEQAARLPAATVQQLTISPDNDNVFVAVGSAGTEQIAFTAGNSAPFGTESNIAVKKSAGAAVSVAVDPSDRMVYIGETAASSGTENTGGVRVFTYSTMSEISASPYGSGGVAPYAILPLSDGDYVYVANRTVSGSSDGNIKGFEVATSGSSYSLTALSTTVTTGIEPESLAADSDGSYLLAVDFGGSPDLEAYTFDSTTAGQLDSAFTAATGTDPAEAVAIAAAP